MMPSSELVRTGQSLSHSLFGIFQTVVRINVSHVSGDPNVLLTGCTALNNTPSNGQVSPAGALRPVYLHHAKPVPIGATVPESTIDHIVAHQFVG